MRGKDDLTCFAMDFPRITPAYAGKSFATIRSEAPFRDHPRLCGEKENPFDLKNYSKGSPPPMRGKASKNGRGQMIERITPAYAGKRAGTMRILL